MQIMRSRSILALSNFFAVAHFFLIVYIITPYLATMISAETAGLAVALGAVLTLAAFPYMPKLVMRHGPQRMAVVLAGSEGVLLLLLATYPSALVATMLIALACALPPLIVYQLDLLLEACIEDERTTGRIRTAFITAANVALIAAPLVAGYVLNNGNQYGRVFVVAALSVIPFILLMFSNALPRVHPPGLRTLRAVGVNLLSDPDRRAVAFSNLVLQFFFHLVPLYVPLYLHTVLGMPWHALGILIALSLVPNVLLEYPAGWLADTKLGDRTLLALGFTLAGLCFAALTFVRADTSLWVTFSILFVMRIGTSFMEAMTEVHFFRKVSADDAEAVSVFRMMRPLGALTAPIVGSILLSTASFNGVFVVGGFGTLIAGVTCAYAMRGSLGELPTPVTHAIRPAVRSATSTAMLRTKEGNDPSLWPRSGSGCC
jgi:MFS family permease